MKYKSKILIIILILWCVLKKIKVALIFPFKILKMEDSNFINNFNIDDIINNMNHRKTYTEIEIGEPPQKIKAIFDMKLFGTSILHGTCDLPDSNYIKNNSITYKEVDEFLFKYEGIYDCFQITETIYINDSHKQKIKIENFPIIYSDNSQNSKVIPFLDKNQQNTCINIGLKFDFYNNKYEKNNNIVNELKKLNIIESYVWGIKYISKDEGYIFMGEEPHIFDSENYNVMQYKLSGSINELNPKDWYLAFDNIYYTIFLGNNIFKNISLDSNKVKIDFNFNLIQGSKEYYNTILESFFNDLINHNKCFMKRTKNSKVIIYCDKSQYIYLKKNFPTLKLYIKQYKKIFELDYNDLFMIKNEQILFLIYFNLNSDEFIFGSIFLYKYLLIFNYDTKMIGFYNEKFPSKNIIKINIKNKLNYFVISLLIFLFFIIGFLLGKKIYYKARYRRKNEITDDFDYNITKNFQNKYSLKKNKFELKTNFI